MMGQFSTKTNSLLGCPAIRRNESRCPEDESTLTVEGGLETAKKIIPLLLTHTGEIAKERTT